MIAKSFSIIPNPNSGKFTLTAQNQAPIKDIIIINAIGQVVYTFTKTNSNTLDLNLDLLNGIYFVKVNFGQTQTIQKLVIAD